MMGLNSYEKVKAYDGIFTRNPVETPSSKVPDGPMFGNGDIGVVAGGTSEKLTFWLAKNDFWNYTRSHDTHLKGGVRGLACLSLESYRMKGAAFHAKQKIGTAEVEIDLTTEECHLHAVAYAPRGESIVLCEIEAVRGGIPMRVRFVPLADEAAEFSHIFRESLICITKNYVHNVIRETKAAGCCRIMGWDADSEWLREGDKALIAISLRTNYDLADHERQAERDVVSLDEEKLTVFRRRHEEWWANFWNASCISIPSEPEIEKFWYGSHYLMACCCESGKVAPGLFGNWVTGNDPAWAGDYHLNYNYQAPWWGVYSSNHVELSEPFDQPVLDYIPTAKEHARRLLNCRGVYGKVGIGPMGYESSRMFRPDGTEDENMPFWGQKSNCAYAAINMLMRFYSTWDEAYARSCLLPYLREVAEFWEDYLKYEDGRYVIYNDCIHENSYEGRGIFEWAKSFQDHSDDYNPILSLALVRMIFRGMLDVSEFLGINEEKREKWEHILTHTASFPTQIREGKTVFRYTERGMDWCGDNDLGIQHVYPVGAIGLSSGEELLTIARDTVSALGRWSDFNAFPTFFTAAARVGYNPETILSKLKEQFLNHSFPNYFIFFGGGGIECCSAVPGCINEMLFQSHENVLRFFPVWDRSKEASFDGLRGYGAFKASAELKKGEIGEIRIVSEKGRPCAVLCPWKDGMTVLTEDGLPVSCEIESAEDGYIFRFGTEAGCIYRLNRLLLQ